MLNELLAERNLPDVLSFGGEKIRTAKEFDAKREEIRRLLESEEYGVLPPKPEHLEVVAESDYPAFCRGSATLTHYTAKVTLDGEEFSFPFYAAVPKRNVPVPAFVFINFRSQVPDFYCPLEEVMDRGYAVFGFCYLDVASDDGNFRKACAKFLSKNRRASDASGKIMMWAWAAMRVMDFIETLPEIDHDNVAVIGHSRLGKTALVTGAFDERFRYVISNDSGCSGAAITRGKIGESLEAINDRFPFWFCPQYKKYYGAAETLPFDQHWLLSLICPRHILIGSAEEDLWSDPTSEFLALYAVTDVYRLYGKEGLVTKDGIPVPDAALGEGDALYQVRHGAHYFSRADWLAYLAYMDRFTKR
ncbi:MAG TPA: acetylxylan esterase [Clostridiales bacterium]|nr:acetylxylan esterase [Clostridiales bacterium]